MSQELDLFDFEQHPEFKEETFDTGFRRITYYNQNYDWHDGTDVVKGGFGIELKDGLLVPQVGRVQKIKHQQQGGGSKEVDEMVTTELECAIIATSKPYTSYWPDGNRSMVPVLAERYFTPPDGERETGISFFVVIRADEQRRLWEIRFKTFNVDYAIAVLNEVQAASRAVKRQMEKVSGRTLPDLMRYALWVTLVPGETIKVGKEKQGNCTKIALKWPKQPMTDEDYFAMRVAREEYAKHNEMRREIEAMFATGFRQPVSRAQLSEATRLYLERAAERVGEPTGTRVMLEDLADPETAKMLISQGISDENFAKRNQIDKARAKMTPSEYGDAEWPLVSFLALNGTKAVGILNQRIVAVTGDTSLNTDVAMSLMGFETVKDIPPKMTVKDFLERVAAESTKK